MWLNRSSRTDGRTKEWRNVHTTTAPRRHIKTNLLQIAPDDFTTRKKSAHNLFFLFRFENVPDPSVFFQASMPAKKKQSSKSKKPVSKRLNVPAVQWAAQNGTQRFDRMQKKKYWNIFFRDETINEIKTKFAALDLKSVEILEATEVQFPKGIAVEQLAAVGCCTEAQGKELAKFENLMEVVRMPFFPCMSLSSRWMMDRTRSLTCFV